MEIWRSGARRAFLFARTVLLSSCVAAVSHAQGAGLQASGARPAVSTGSPVAHAGLVNQYCASCHNQKLKTAGLLLDRADLNDIPSGAELWEKVLRKLRSGAMPPPGAPRPAAAAITSFASYLETSLDRAAAASPNPGRPALRRLNRAEYVNAVRDLLGLDVDAVQLGALLPADDSGYGFDNIGDVLSVSPLLLENYLSAARQISRLALGYSAARAEQTIYDVPRFLSQNDRISEALPFGSRGGIAIRHYFPRGGDYMVKVRLKTTYDGSRILGIAEAHALDVWLDGARVAQTGVGGEGQRPSRYDTALRLDSTAPAGQASQPAPVPEPAQLADADFQVPISVSAGTHLIGVSFLRETWEDETLLPPLIASRDELEPGIGSVVIDGPQNTSSDRSAAPAAPAASDTPSRRKMLTCRPGSSREPEGKDSFASARVEEDCAWNILSALARRAFRRPITDADREILLNPFRFGRRGGDFQSGIDMALVRVLVSPEFLYRIERDPPGSSPGAVHPINGLELASRLSSFLWSSIPDDELLNLGEKDQLRQPAVLRAQVGRMLADVRSRALVENFAGQWLYLRNLRSAAPDLGEFPEFDENLRAALQRETELFFESTLREDRSVLELLSSDQTFLNERLARHYGIRGVYGSHFRRIKLTDPERHGLLGKGSILTVTSYANRTSPVLRGKWLLENILGAPPPPPPPNVPPIQERNSEGKLLSMRQVMEQHRASPACASCHKLMDPLGFALENFDAIGKWRLTSGAGDLPVDASGIAPDGTPFAGPSGLRSYLLHRKEEFLATATVKLLTYALGRGVESYDQPAVRQILRRAERENYRWSSLILGIAESAPFQMRRSP